MIQFIDTSFSYQNKPLLSSFSLNIAAGEKVVLYGGSGAGKSTILHSIMGFVLPDSGEICINKTPLTHRSVTFIRQQTAWLPQEFSLPYQLVQEVIFAPFDFKANSHKRPTSENVIKDLQSVGLTADILTKPFNELSGGQRQRVMLVTTVMLDKPIILLDEPTSALDAQSIQLVIDYLKSHTDMTMIAVSHDQRFINAFDTKYEVKPLKQEIEL